MRILFLTQWFNPEPQFKGLAFAKALQEQGHTVEVLTGFPNYPGGQVYPGYKIRLIQREVMEGVPILRVALYPSHDQSAIRRILNYVSFALSAAILGPFLISKADVMYVLHPPATVGLPATVISFLRRIPFVYDIQDLWPDTLMSTGMVRHNWILALVAAWCKIVYRAADRIVVLSHGFKSKLIQRGVPERKIQVIQNWCDENKFISGCLRKEEQSCFKDRFSIVFAGNLGKAQALMTVLRAARILQISCPDAHFFLVGSGLEMESLQQESKQLSLQNVTFLPHRPIAEMGTIFQHADALLVHLKRDPLFEITIPSKVQAYLFSGRPILAGLSGDAAALVEEANAGITFEPEDTQGLVNAVLKMRALAPEERESMGMDGHAFYKENMSLNTGVRRFLDLFSDLMPREIS